MKRYRLYGANVVSEHVFAAPVPHGNGSPDLTIRVGEWTSRAGAELTRFPPDSETPAIRLHRTDGGLRLWTAGSGEFEIGTGEILCRSHDDIEKMEVQLLGLASAVWLERGSVPVLHAAAVSRDGRAMAILGDKGSGKTLTTAHLLRRGAALLTDDLLAVRSVDGRIAASPGYPQLRMWPEQAAAFVDDPSSLDRAHPDYDKLRIPLDAVGLGSFDPVERPVQAMAVLEPGGSRKPERLGAQESLIEMVRHSFASPFLRHIAGGERLRSLAELAEAVPVWRVAADPNAEATAALLDEHWSQLETAGA